MRITIKFGDLRIPARIWNKCLEQSQPYDCWIWQGCRDKNGYGTAWRDAARRATRVHRWMFELTEIPFRTNFVLDHAVCANPSCVNPTHLEQVTPQINTIRGRGPEVSRRRQLARIACKYGHLYQPGSYRLLTSGQNAGKRFCLLCQQARRLTPEQLKQSRQRGQAKIAARTHCHRGHAYADHAIVLSNGRRRCIPCYKAATDRYRDREASRKAGIIPPKLKVGRPRRNSP